MDKSYEERYFEFGKKSWWHSTRRDFVHRLISKKRLSSNSSIFDIGCSNGLLLDELKKKGYRNLYGIDVSSEAIKECRKKHSNVFVRSGEKTGFGKEKFDLLVASDILEHIKDHDKALLEWHKILKKNGVAIVFVPAFKFLWSYPDELNHHYRRYTLKKLKKMSRRAGFKVVVASYWNFFLFPLHFLVTTLKNLLNIKKDNLSEPREPVNSLLAMLLKLENWLIINRFPLPFGISCVVVLKKY